jgi:hypothetical protein
MAKLLLTTQDVGDKVPLTGAVFWDVVGSSKVDLFEIAAGTKASILGGQGQDVFRLLGEQSDYTVHQTSTNAVFTHQVTGHTVIIRTLSTTGDFVAFGEDGALLSLKIADGAIMLGTQRLSSTPADVTATSDGEAGSTVVLDHKGTATTALELDADGDGFTFTDATATSNNVRITNFTDDDRIIISGASASDYDDGVIGTNAAGDVTITYNESGILNQITLIGVVTDDTLVSDVDSFNALPVGDLSFS